MIPRASCTRAAVNYLTYKNLCPSTRCIHHAIRYAAPARRRPARRPHAGKPQVSRPQKEGLPPLRTLEMIEEYRSCLHNEQVVEAFQLYQMLKKILSEEDISSLIDVLHNPKAARLVDSASMLRAADAIAEDLRVGSIPAVPSMTRGLLHYYKISGNFDEGTQFWEWAATQDALLNARVYGAAIEFGLARGDSLASLESLYQQAIASSDNSFLGYHLSHNAILADHQNVSMITGTSESLLRAICLARLQHGDYHNAYLAFDTALRLHPTTIDYRFFEPFIQIRSINEAYIVYQIACRNPSSRSAKLLKLIIRRLLTLPTIKKGNALVRIRTLNTLLSAIRAYVEGGETVGVNLVAPYQSLLQVVYALLPQPEEEASDAVRSSLLSSIGIIASSMADQSVELAASNVNMLLNAAARLQSRDLFEMTMKSSAFRRINSAPKPVFQRVLLYSVGALQDAPLVETTWRAIQQSQDVTSDPQEAYKVWMTFGRAAKRAGILPFFHSEFEIHKGRMEPYIREHLLEHFPVSEGKTNSATLEDTDNRDKNGDDGSTSPKPRQYWASNDAVSSLTVQISEICEALKSQRTRDFAENPFRMTLGKPLILLSEAGSEQVSRLRAVYDAMTVDPSAGVSLASGDFHNLDTGDSQSTQDESLEDQSPPQPRSSSGTRRTAAADTIPTTATGYKIDELRYANWAAVTELLAEAEEEESSIGHSLPTSLPESIDLAQTVVRLRTPRQFTKQRLQQLEGLEILDD